MSCMTATAYSLKTVQLWLSPFTSQTSKLDVLLAELLGSLEGLSL